MWATIEISIVPYDIAPPGDRKSLKLRASLSGVGAKYKASNGSGAMMLENDGSFAREIRLDQADEDMFPMFPVVRPTPEESFGLIIKRISPKKDRK